MTDTRLCENIRSTFSAIGKNRTMWMGLYYACFGKSRREVTIIVSAYKIKKHLSITMATFLHCARATSSVSVRLLLGSSRSKTPDTLPCMNTPREIQSIIIWEEKKTNFFSLLLKPVNLRLFPILDNRSFHNYCLIRWIQQCKIYIRKNAFQ